MKGITLHEGGAFYVDGRFIPDNAEASAALGQLGVTASKEEAKKGTMAYGILSAHNTSATWTD